jgi:hypothetical protein
MGHDIRAYLKSDSTTDDCVEIAEMHRGAINPLNRVIYQSLKCVEKNHCGVSGCGTRQEFSLENLKDALGDIAGEEDLRPEITFLENCINADNGSGFIIHFF